MLQDISWPVVFKHRHLGAQQIFDFSGSTHLFPPSEIGSNHSHTYKLQFSGSRWEENIETHRQTLFLNSTCYLFSLSAAVRLCHIICLTLRPQFPLPPSKHTLIWKVRRESKCKIEILRLTSLRCARRLVSSHLRLSSVAYLPPSCQGGAPKIGSRLTPQSPLINVELCRLHTIMKASKSLGF